MGEKSVRFYSVIFYYDDIFLWISEYQALQDKEQFQFGELPSTKGDTPGGRDCAPEHR